MLGDLKEKNITLILHLLTITENEAIGDISELNERQSRGVYSLFYLTRALIQNKFNHEIDLILFSEYAREVTKLEERINPLNASFFGLGKVISQEYPHLHCRCIDLDQKSTVEEIINDLQAAEAPYHVALREGQRYIEEFSMVNLANLPDQELKIKEEGVYIITGGTGGIGLEIGKWLAQKNKVNLALINRSALPKRENWDELLTLETNSKLSRKITAIREMEGAGAKVSCYFADVTRFEEMERVITDLKARHGRINGIIHGAGVAGDGFIILKEEEVFDAVIAPKVQGAWILDQLIGEDDTDFFILFSSITAITGGVGQGDYTAANSYLDSFAAFRNKQGKRTLTINWPAWKDTGMAVDYGVNDDQGIMKAIPTAKAIYAFEEVFNKEVTNILIGELNYNLILQFENNFPLELSDDLTALFKKRKSKAKVNQQQVVSARERDQKHTNDVVIKGEDEDYSETVLKVARIWVGLLGMEEVDIYESFYEMGGDSILATHLLGEMEKEFPGLVDVSDIFTYSTIDEMSQYIDSRLNKQHQTTKKEQPKEVVKDKFDDILDQLLEGKISVNEAEKKTLGRE